MSKRFENHMEKYADHRKTWNAFWFDRAMRHPFKIKRYASLSARTRKIETYIEGYLGFFKDLEVVELGSGVGTQSLLMSLQGAKITLVDFSEVALQKARNLFKEFGLNPTCYEADIFDLDSDFFGRFDISMSFGSIEHFFDGYQRKEAISIHYKVLRKRGLSFISVPNKMCPHYSIFHWAARLIGRRILEKPFSSRELITCGQKAGYRYCETFGSSLLESDYLMPYLYVPVQAQVTTPLDNYCAHALTLFGVK